MPGSTRMELKRRKTGIKGIHLPEAPDKVVWCRFPALADRLGFASTEITSLKDRAQPSFDITESGKLDKHWSGRPFDLANEQSRNALLLDGFHSANQSQGRRINPFFVKSSTYLAFFVHLSFSGQTAPRTPPTEAVVEHPRETYDETMSGQDAGQADQGQRDPAQHDISHEDLVSEGPSLRQTSQGRCIPRKRAEKYPLYLRAILDENIGRVESQSGYGLWGLEAPLVMGSSNYSMEDKEVPDSTVAHAGDEGYVLEVTSNSRVGVKFVLREGDGRVE
ncbi:hypothetical protein ACLMJK_009405 [Lecanora helva]